MSQEKDVSISPKAATGLLKLVERAPFNPSRSSPLWTQQEFSLSSEQYGVLEQCNARQKDNPELECFDALFRRQVACTPQATAVVEEEERISYQELETRVDRLARHLQQRAIGPEKAVAVVAERGWKFLTAVLAIFRAGGMAVPLDPQAPVARLCQILKHSGSHLLLTPVEGVELIQQAFAEQKLAQPPDVLCLEALLAEDVAVPVVYADSHARNAAYVLYISVAKETPKGLVVEHHSLMRQLYALRDELRLTERDNVAQVASINSHLSFWQMLTPLLAGAQVNIFADHVAQNPLSLAQQAGERQITLLQVFPSTLRGLLEKLERIESFLPDLLDLRLMLLTGEALPSDLCLRWFKLYPHIPLFYTYGSVEGMGDATLEKITAPLAAKEELVPLGYPLSPAQIYIVDERQELVPPGVAGEICLGGAGLARGYLGEAAATAEVFVPNGGGQVSGARLYRTGDRGRWREDGTLEYVGRADRLATIHGQQIELDEVESQLSEHAEVLQCAVVLKQETADKQQILAYVVGRDALTASELRTFLSQTLPAYMLPQAFLFVESLPLLPDGTVDRQALPRTTDVPLMIHSAGAQPSTPLEEVLAMVWSEVLGKEPPGVDADFFENGGHSLLALELMARLSDLFDLALPLPWLFENPTVAGLARVMLEDESHQAHIQAIASSLIEVASMSSDEIDLRLQDFD